MRHSQSPQTEKKIKRLLQQYKEYHQATEESEKERIGDEMTFANPIIWMIYKHKAYLGSDDEITTIGTLRNHCTNHDSICAKRFHYLAQTLKQSYGKDIYNQREFTDAMNIEALYESDVLERIVSNADFIRGWEKYEYFKDANNKVAKWQNYRV